MPIRYGHREGHHHRPLGNAIGKGWKLAGAIVIAAIAATLLIHGNGPGLVVLLVIAGTIWFAFMHRDNGFDLSSDRLVHTTLGHQQGVSFEFTSERLARLAHEREQLLKAGTTDGSATHLNDEIVQRLLRHDLPVDVAVSRELRQTGPYPAGGFNTDEKAEMLERLLTNGIVEARRGYREQAEIRFMAALGLAQELQRPYDEGRVLVASGRMHAAQGESERARDRFEAARTIFQRLTAMNDLGRVDWELKRLDPT
jgi:hypothetical protein